MTQQTATAKSSTLPADGMSRWNQIEQFSPFSREKFRQLVNAGKAPQRSDCPNAALAIQIVSYIASSLTR